MSANLRVIVPVYSTWEPQFGASMWKLSAATNAVLDQSIATYIDKGRNDGISRLKEPFALFLDADMKFGVADVQRLFRAMMHDPKLGSIGGLYVKRDGSELPVCNWKDGKTGEWLDDDERRRMVAKLRGVHEVGYWGGGFVLARAEAINDMEFPWFDGGYGEWDGYMSEDCGFCLKMRDAGWKVALDFSVRLGHQGKKLWEPEEMRKEPLLAVQ